MVQGPPYHLRGEIRRDSVELSKIQECVYAKYPTKLLSVWDSINTSFV